MQLPAKTPAHNGLPVQNGTPTVITKTDDGKISELQSKAESLMRVILLQRGQIDDLKNKPEQVVESPAVQTTLNAFEASDANAPSVTNKPRVTVIVASGLCFLLLLVIALLLVIRQRRMAEYYDEEAMEE